MIYREREGMEPVERDFAEITLDELAAAYREVLRRADPTPGPSPRMERRGISKPAGEAGCERLH